MRARPAFAAAFSFLAWSASAGAAVPRGVAPAGGGLDALEATIDAGALRVRRCKSADCSDTGGGGRTLPIPIERTRLDLAGAVVESLAIGEGKHVLHVRVADLQRKDLAFEALVAGEGEPIFAGLTGYTRGEEGERTGSVVLVYDRDERTKFVLVGEAREDTRICGQSMTPNGARGLDPKTMQLRGATLHRLEKKARDEAARIVAAEAPAGKPALARLLVATGGSAPGAQALTDARQDTTWSEKRPGDGHGEFATMRAPYEVPLHAVVVTIAPPAPRPEGAAPRTFYLATDQRLFHVTVPDDAWLKPGAAYEVAFPEPVRTTCLALVLDEAYPRALGAPEVSIAEVVGRSGFDVDGASLDDVVKELGGARAEESAAILRRSGDDGLAAVSKQWATLDPRARALAVDVAASTGTCEGAGMELLTRALADKESEVKRRALGRIERCGKSAATSLAAAVRSNEEPRRAAAAPLLAAIAPSLAIDPIADVLGQGAVDTRRSVRGALGRAATSAPRDKLLALLTAAREREPAARLDLLRALGARLPELRPEASAALADVLRGTPDMPTRWLAAQPLAQLARSTDATTGELTRLSELIRRDPDWPVRARAVETAIGIPPLVPAIVAATSDPEPRVREAALHAIAASKIAAGLGVSATSLARDPWTFVRVAGAEAIGAGPESGAGQAALATALADGSPRVRSAAILGLGAQRATRQAPRIRERLDDTREDVEVRAIAARTLGAMCIRDAADRLTKLALLARAPVDEADERIGMAALEALALLHPADLDKRLAPLRGKDVRLPLRRAADLAVAEPGACR